MQCKFDLPVNQQLRLEYMRAIHKHPRFPVKPEEAITIITEELGELARETNDKETGWQKRAYVEAAHVAVTAIRTMQALSADDTTSVVGDNASDVVHDSGKL